MRLSKEQNIELKITDLAFGGNGVAKIKSENGDFVIFVAGAVPGDTVCARFTKIKKNYAEAKTIKILEASADRISARCKHFGICGGCSMQFLSYENQLKWKEEFVADAFEKIGGIKNLQLLPIMGGEEWFYRNKMEYSFAQNDNIRYGITQNGDAQNDDARYAITQNGNAQNGDAQNDDPEKETASKLNLGLHVSKKFNDVFDLEECFLQSPVSLKILLAVKRWAAEKKLKGMNLKSGEGLLRNLVIREGKNTNEIMVNLAVNGEAFELENEFAEFILKNFPAITSLYWTSVKIRRGFRTVIQEHFLAGKKVLTEKLILENGRNGEVDEAGRVFQRFLSLNFDILPQAFFQPNTVQAQKLYGKILEFADAQNSKTVLDLFCGTGTIGMFFAKCGAQVTGIDLNESAILNAKSNAANNGLENIDFKCGDIVKFLPDLCKKTEILITDPPRAGIADKSLKEIVRLKIPTWIYVSCNPATLARDIKYAVENGYKLEKIQPVDMFPQTYHVESICLLTDPSKV